MERKNIKPKAPSMNLALPPSTSNFETNISATTTPKYEVNDPVTSISNKVEKLKISKNQKKDDENTTNSQTVDPTNKILSAESRSQEGDDENTTNSRTINISSANSIRQEKDDNTSIDEEEEDSDPTLPESPINPAIEKEKPAGLLIEELLNGINKLYIKDDSPSELPEKQPTSSSSSTIANHTLSPIELGSKFYYDISLRQEFLNLISSQKPIPIDSPIFRKLANTTTSIAHYMNEIKIPGEQLYTTGTATEKLSNIGKEELAEIESELVLINENLESGLILSTKNATYFSDRTKKILDMTTKLRDLIETVYKAVILTENIYVGHQYHLQNGFLDLTSFFDKNEATLRRLNINVKFVKEDLATFDHGISKVLDAKGNIKISLDGINRARTFLIEIKEKFSILVGRKIFSVHDSESIREAIENIKKTKQIWKEKDYEAVSKRIKI
ncbi:9484_t:CDS:2 [Ambispora gerdemannii]|uniref:9484_t:CDS:1 n=1 Tax=Ambispora gerdemannii TaxID=144530 RepID=A0A9N8W309_9GLOM|nr:9484_t:CDS:2 [Ambispora gerdemannii]